MTDSAQTVETTAVTASDDLGPARDDGDEPSRGTLVGRYVLLDRLGSGGMGLVYAAYDPELDRRVAIKLLRPLADGTPQPRERLLREAQAMARLSHRNVVAVHDVGTYGGRLFMAIELVEGATLRQWLAPTRRSWRSVVDVMLAAGRGLAAAHRAGLVHRDFKPDNVLVGDDGHVRVADFGLARALPDRADEIVTEPGEPNLVTVAGTTLTRPGAVIGTPGYMAPEQLRAHVTDARTDQFAFCVTLYEALAGARPFPEDPGEPSKPMPVNRRIPRRVMHVVERGLSAEPVDRFPSLDALLAELGRKRVALRWSLLAAAIVLVISGGVAAGVHAEASVQPCGGVAGHTQRIWNIGRQSAVLAAFTKTGRPFAADAARVVDDAVADWMGRWQTAYVGACEATRVRREQPEDVLSLRMSCLDRALDQVDSLVDVFVSADAGIVEKAVPAVSALPDVRVCADVVTLGAPLPPDLAVRGGVELQRDVLARSRAERDAGRYKPALATVRAVTVKARALQYRPLIAESLALLGDLEDKSGAADDAEHALSEALLVAQASRADDVFAEAATRLAAVVGTRQAHYAAGHQWAKLAAATVERMGGHDGMLVDALTVDGNLFYAEGKFADALAEGRRAVMLSERVYGPSHYATARALGNVALVLKETNQTDAAIAAFERQTAIFRATLGPHHPETSKSIANLGLIYSKLGRLREAEAMQRQALAIREAALGPDHPDVANVVYNLGDVLRMEGRLDDALVEMRRALAIRTAALPAGHPAIGRAHVGLGLTLRYAEHYVEAERELEAGLAILAANLGPDHPDVGVVLHDLGDTELGQDKFEPAIDYFKRELAVYEKALGPTNVDLAYPLVGLGEAYLGLGDARSARTVLERAWALRRAAASSDDDLAQTRFALARALWATGSRDEALHHARAARVLFDKTEADAHLNRDRIDRWLSAHDHAR